MKMYDAAIATDVACQNYYTAKLRNLGKLILHEFFVSLHIYSIFVCLFCSRKQRVFGCKWSNAGTYI